MELHEVCRICLLPKKSVQSIFSAIQLPHSEGSEDTKFSKHSILEILKIFTSISVYPNDDILDIICCDCFDKVRRSFTFKLKLEKSEAILKKLKDGGNTINEWTDSLNEYHNYSEGNIKIKIEKEDYDKLEPTTVQDIYTHVVSFEQEFKQEPEIQINTEYCNETDSSENGSKMKNASNLNSHTLTSTEELPFQCEVCAKKYRFRSSLKEHLKTSHDLSPCTDENLFECEVCSKVYRNKHNLVHHMKKAHSNISTFQCSICSECFECKYTLDQHEMNHTEEKVFQCEICPESFHKKFILMKHVRTVHPEGTHNINMKCSICSKLFEDEYVLKRHMVIHTGEKPFLCKICKKKFRQNANLKDHIRRLHGSNCTTNNIKFECDKCSKSFEHEMFLQQHMLIHSDEILFQCEFCTTNFESKDKFRQHMRTVHPEVTVKKIRCICPICSKLFTQESGLKNHMNIHTGHKPYMCKICGNKFRFKSVLRGHMRRMHAISHDFNQWTDISVPTKVLKCGRVKHMKTAHANTSMLKCPICSKFFENKMILQQHSRVHSANKVIAAVQPKGIHNINFKCSICSKLFVHKQSLKRHLMAHTGERPFPCKFCGKKFQTKGNLTEHIGRAHGSDCITNKKFEYVICSKFFEHKKILEQHMLIPSVNNECLICSKLFTI